MPELRETDEQAGPRSLATPLIRNYRKPFFPEARLPLWASQQGIDSRHSPAVCGAGAGAGFGITFLTVAFFLGACFAARGLALCFAAGAALVLAARTAAQRFLVAATMAARPAAESRRLGFAG
jgi:hypothetical protein